MIMRGGARVWSWRHRKFQNARIELKIGTEKMIISRTVDKGAGQHQETASKDE